jgi:acetyltransferase-like isoleucine patch superfamily enzyme
VIIREECTIGDNFRIWSNSAIEYGVVIGNNVKFSVCVMASQFTIIEDDVFLAGQVAMANDMHPGCPESLKCMRGPHIKRGAQIGACCVILPNVVIGEFAMIGAGSVVTKDIPAGVIAYGNPARVVCGIEDVVCKSGRRDKPYAHLLEKMMSGSGGRLSG